MQHRQAVAGEVAGRSPLFESLSQEDNTALRFQVANVEIRRRGRTTRSSWTAAARNEPGYRPIGQRAGRMT